jgi:CBS domain-containing protein
MITGSKPLASLTARDLMNHEVVAIPQHTTLRAAAQVLGREHISGAPVVDAQGRCVGILSAADFVGLWARGGPLPQGEVCRYMTADPVTVEKTAPVTELARKMIDAHIHRVIVVDEEGHPVGVVSSTDILAAVSYSGTL